MTVIVNEQMFDNAAAKQTIKTIVVCPRCKNNFCQRIPRGSIVKGIFSWLPLKHYKCDRCIKHFYRIDK